jgi:hypothetical protein
MGTRGRLRSYSGSWVRNALFASIRQYEVCMKACVVLIRSTGGPEQVPPVGQPVIGNLQRSPELNLLCHPEAVAEHCLDLR